ncbi:hypothetical protein QBC32DRAFT_379537 [Pseudoneurospora amorphoporcata]|uniref:2EXR domain-containing protein n=1 Tax=Pseudoneurospora amorphoporcata TaxID=241081 RepID=A0AAN6SIY7_9PEZI|nr:hypothetical protein QBC32DRAFT_379537 [Pseudoneurospora amorphoporcata]
MTTFHPFPRLPPELRLRIWGLTVEPRTVDFRIANPERTMGFRIDTINGTPNNVVQLRSSTPRPATLQACREARNHLSSGEGRRELHEQVFCDLVPPTSACAPPPHLNNPNYDEAPEPSPLKKNHHHRRYIYLHLPLDTLDIGTTFFHDFFLFLRPLPLLLPRFPPLFFPPLPPLWRSLPHGPPRLKSHPPQVHPHFRGRVRRQMGDQKRS